MDPKRGGTTVKINEVEELVGITKRNIRFYEAEGLLSPRRDSRNGYRDYGDEEVDTLRKIKLLRKLDVPLEEIGKLQTGLLTLEDVLRRHIIQLRRSQDNLNTMEALCAKLADAGVPYPGLDAQAWLEDMARMEQEGTRFMNVSKQDTPRRYVGAVIAAVVFVLLMAGVMALMIWGFTISPEESPPLPLVVVFAVVPLVFIVGVLLALRQRIQQIKGGEEDAASQY